MPPHNWMNDPNGPIWWKGQYHLFYQLNPHAAVWGDMHWGHAVSPDMMHWHHQPIALAPTPGGPDSEGCFSGSAVVFEGEPTFIYTGVQNAPPDQATMRDGSDKLRETQMLAIAEDDNLLRWKKAEKPVIPAPPPGMMVTGFRDPCPWREGDTWYLGIGSGERGKGGCVLLYRSRIFATGSTCTSWCRANPTASRQSIRATAARCGSAPTSLRSMDITCLLYSTENKVIWTTGEYDAHKHLYIPRRPEYSITRGLLRAQELRRSRWPPHPVGMDARDAPRSPILRGGLVRRHDSSACAPR